MTDKAEKDKDQEKDEKQADEKKDDEKADKKEDEKKGDKNDEKKEDEKKGDKKDEKEGALVNKPGEPDFQLKLNLEKVIFKGDKLKEEPASVEVKIENPTDKRHTFKVKCTSNDTFRIRPPLGFVDSKGSTTIALKFQAKEIPELGKHFFVFYHMAVPSDDKATARSLWTASSKPDGVKRLPCDFLKADGSQWPQK